MPTPRIRPLLDAERDLLLREGYADDGRTVVVDWDDDTPTYDGTPRSGGRLRLEYRYDLQPLCARGIGAQVGTYYKHAHSLPQVDSALRRPVPELASLPWRIEKPVAPAWATAEDLDRLELHWALQERVWHLWTRPGEERTLTDLIREVNVTSEWAGFYWATVSGLRKKTFPLRHLAAREWRLPPLPHWRSPSAVAYWLSHGDEPIGVIANFGASRDYNGQGGSSWQLIPWAQIVHVAREQVGSNWEGISALRPVDNHIKMLQEALQLRALGTEVNALGLPVFSLGEGNTDEATVAQYLAAGSQRKANALPVVVLRYGDKLDLIAPQTAMPQMDSQIDSLESDILMGLDSEDREIGVNGEGAFAARSEASQDKRPKLSYLAENRVGKALERALKIALAMNFPDDAEADELWVAPVRCGDAETRDPATFINACAVAHSSGVLDNPALRPAVLDALGVTDAEAVGEAGKEEGIDDDDSEAELSESDVAPNPMGALEPHADPAEVAAYLGVSRGRIVGAIRRGELRGGKIAGVWRVALPSVEEAYGVDIPEEAEQQLASSSPVETPGGGNS